MVTESNSDAYVTPVFSTGNKIRRLVWQTVWLLFCRYTPAPMHSWRVLVLRLFGARLGCRNHIYPSCKIWAPWLLESADLATIGPDVEIYNPGGLYIGDHTILSQGSYVCGATHDYNAPGFTYVKKKIIIESYAWICARSIVLPGVTCKTGSVLAAGAVASRDLEAWAVYVGNPAKKIRERERICH